MLKTTRREPEEIIDEVGPEKATEKQGIKGETKIEGLKEVIEESKPEKITKRSHSNILRCRQRAFSTRILFKLIYNLYFKASLFIIGVAKINELSYLTSMKLL